MYRLVWTDYFIKKTNKFLKKHPDLKEKFKNVILTVELDPFNKALKTHKLQGKFSKLYAISLTHSYRLILDIKITNKEVVLINIGSHDEVYFNNQ